MPPRADPDSVEGPILNDQASQDYLPVPAAADAGDADGGSGAGETADQVRQDDLATLFPASNQSEVFVTRMRADLSQAALGSDLVLEASSDQTMLSNLYYVAGSINGPECGPPCAPCDPSSCDYGPGDDGGSDNPGGSGSGSGGNASSAGNTGGAAIRRARERLRLLDGDA